MLVKTKQFLVSGLRVLRVGFIGKAILNGVRLQRQHIRILGYHQLELSMSREGLRGKDVDVGLRNVKVYLDTSLD